MAQTAWVSPKTWTADELVTNTGLNTYLRDNPGYLFSPPFQQIATGSANDLSASASTAVPIDTTNLSVTITGYGRTMHAYFQGVFGGGRIQLNLLVDGTAWSNRVSGIVRNQADDTHEALIFDVWVTGLATGVHTFKPLWYTTGNYATLHWSGCPAVFWVREG